MNVIQPLIPHPAILGRKAAEHRAALDLRQLQPALQRPHGTGRVLRAAPDLDAAPACLAVDRQQQALGSRSIWPIRLRSDPAAIKADDLRPPQGASKTDEQDRPVAIPSEVIGQHAEHGDDVLRKQRGLFGGRLRMPAADAGHHINDMPVLSGQWVAERAEGGCDGSKLAFNA